MTPAQNARHLPVLIAIARPRTKLLLLLYALSYALQRMGVRSFYRGGVFDFGFGRFDVRAGHGDLGTIGEIFLERPYDQAGFHPANGDTCIDVGANIGCVTVQWLTTNRSGRIIAIEPHPETVRQLRRNLQLNRAANVEVIHAAAAETAGEATLIVDADHGSMGRVAGADTSGMGGFVHQAEVRVPAVTIDAVVAERGLRQIDLLKIDVEGFEVECLRGAVRTLAITTRVIVEYHSPSLRQQCRELLAGAGFAVREAGSLLLAARDGAAA